MDNCLLVCGFQRPRDLAGDRQRVSERHWAMRDTLGECWSLDEFQHQRLPAVRFFKPVNCGDVRMIERGQDLRFSSETREPLEIEGDVFGKDLQRDVAIERRVACAIYLAHAAHADLSGDFIGAESSSCYEGHGA